MDIGKVKVMMTVGQEGSSIASIDLTASTAYGETYTITLTDGTTKTIEVERGVGIASIEKTSTVGLVDTYTITLTDGDTATFTVSNGQSYTVPTDGILCFDGDTAPEGYEETGIPADIQSVLSGLTSPRVALTASDMTDTSAVYIYMGSETGYDTNYFYFYDGSAWVAGAPANGLAVDDTLSIAGASADAKATGDAIDALDSAVSTINETLENKANVDGYYDELTAGNAEQLLSNVFEEDSTPYNFRTTGGNTDVGKREYTNVIGGTVAWNQLVQNGNFADTSGWTAYFSATLSASNNVLSMTVGTATASGCGTNTKYVNGHKYLKTATIKSAIKIQCDIDGVNRDQTTGSNEWETIASVFNWAYNSASYKLYIRRSASGDSTESVEVKNVMLIDLTQMFGSTVADYIYALETSNAGAGVAWFKSLFPKTYYAYNTGELMSVKTSSHNMVGFNAWDEVWELGKIDWDGTNAEDNSRIRSKNYIPCVSETVYYVKSPKSIELFYYDASQNLISFEPFSKMNTTFTTPANCRFIRFFVYDSAYGTTYKDDICINISWDGERNGEYEPYTIHKYALDGDLELRGWLKLDANNKLYCDGDTYVSDGTVTRKYGIVDLGTLTWARTASGLFNTESLRYVIKKPTQNLIVTTGIISTIYTPMNSNDINGPNGSNPSPDRVMAVNVQGAMYFNNVAYTDATTFKSAMSGVYLVYELETETTETADPFANPQICDDWGTEDFVDNRAVAIPVGHFTKYMANLKAKLEMAPNSPSSNGDFIVRHANGQNEYVPLTKELPVMPTTDGTYHLKCTVASGVGTLSWEVDA